MVQHSKNMKKNKRQFKAAFFDMDGILIDSELYWTKIEKKFAEKYGLTYNQNYRREIMGLSEIELAQIVRQKFKVKKSIKQILAERNKTALIIYQKWAQPLPGALSLIKKIKQRGLKTALVSSSPWNWINPILRRFKLRKQLDAIISAEDMLDNHGKPHPAIYLFAAQRLKVEPKDCLVFEDSVNGIKAAKAAGMFCVAVPDKRWVKDRQGIAVADVVAGSLRDKKISKILDI